MKLFLATKALVIREGRILILREADTYAEGTEAGKWDVPGGRINDEEPFLDGLSRELQEECGLLVSDPCIISVQENFPIIRGEQCHIVRMYFTVTGGSESVILSQDHDAFLWIDPKDHLTHGLIADVHDVFDIYLKKLI